MTTHDSRPGGSETSATTTSFRELAAALTGTVVTPQDEAWDAARQPWVLGVDQRPVAVVHAASAQDASETVRFAARHGLSVAAQARGHGATGRLDGAILLRTDALDEIQLNVSQRTARVGAGVVWGDLLAALDGTGLVGVPGSSPHVSVVGYCLGGGVSWFGRAFGTGAGSLRAVELVDAEGTRRWVTAESDPDLFWALRGGGGDFGIVTAVDVELFAARQVYGGRLMFPGAAAAPVLQAYAEVSLSAPDELTLWATVMHFPDVPMVPAEVRGQSFTLVDAMYVGGASDAEALLAPLRAAGPVVRQTVRALLPSEIGAVSEEPADPSPAVSMVRSLTSLDPALLEGLLAVAGPGSGTALTMFQIRRLGGALATSNKTGAGTTVAAPYVLVALGAVPVPALEGPVRAGLDAVLSVIRTSITPDILLTALAPEDTISAAFDAPTLDRLRAVKRAVDPNGVIRSNYPVLAD